MSPRRLRNLNCFCGKHGDALRGHVFNKSISNHRFDSLVLWEIGMLSRFRFDFRQFKGRA